ncbi:uncharacterized protein [Ranitomeya imitator]|uniref:uncharacterized protein n=1 Tax=Ranitomeya imitator TaxID=111125 RepID=UPI0037E9B5A7
MDRVILWTRYIDDVFLIWRGTPDTLEIFFRDLNKNDQNIRLTYKYHTSQIEFLDVMIKKDDSGFLQTDIFRKDTAVNAILHATSSHPTHVVRSISVSQFLRIRRICSTDGDFEKQSIEMKKRFYERGYSKRSIKHAYNRARNTNRHDLLYSKTDKQKVDSTRMITQYHSQWSKMYEVMKKHWPILMADKTLRQYIPPAPAITARRCDNLRDHLVRSFYTPTNQPQIFKGKKVIKTWGCKPCRKCIACPNIEEAKEFFSSDGKKFTITHTINCSTQTVIYYAKCPCSLVYVGLTTRALKVRVREHVRGIIAAANESDLEQLKTIPRHFKEYHSCDPSGLKVRGIDHIRTNFRGGNLGRSLAQKEAKWIWTLKTVQPDGLNKNLSFAPFI